MKSKSVVSIFLVAVGLLMASLLLMYLVGLAALTSRKKVGSERALLQHLEQSISTLKDAETGQRGYLLTGDEKYLEPYRQALARVKSEQQALRQLSSSGELPDSKVQAIIGLTEDKLTELEQTIQLRKTGSLEAVLPVVHTGEGKATMDKIRAAISELSAAHELDLQHELQSASSAVALRTVTYVLMTLLNLGVLAWAYRRIVREIGAREAAVQETTEQKELLATTLVSIGDGVIATDAQGRITFLNPEAERLTVWPNAEAVGQPLPAVFHIVNEQTRRRAENPVEKVFRTGKVVGLANHTTLIGKNGTETPIDDSAAPIRKPDGSLSGVVLVFRDFTEQRRAQEDRARLAAIVEFSGDAVVSKNLEGLVQTWNAGAERLFGYQKHEIIGRPVALLIPQDRLNEEDQILDRLHQGQPSEYLETIRVGKNGSRIPVSVSVSPIKDGEGQVIGASKIVRDITDLVAAREAVAREKELLATTLASIGDAVIVTDAGGRVTFLNLEAETLTGWKSSDAVGRPLPEIFRIINEQTRQTVENPVEKVLRHGTVVGLANHTLLLAKDGREIPIDDSAAPIRQPGGPLFGVVLVFRDFTGHKQAEQAQVKYIRMMDSGFDAIIVRDAQDRIMVWNRGAMELYGWTRDEALGQVTHSLFKTEFPKPLSSILAELLQNNHWEGELVHRIKGGARITVFSRWTLERDAQAQPASILETNMDITERKRSEQALQQSRERLQGIISSAMDAVITIDSRQRIVLFNPAAEVMFGLSAKEAEGKPIDVLIPERFRSTHGKFVDAFGRTGVSNRKMGALGAISGLRASGQEFPIEASISQIEIGGEKLFTVILRDITERKRAEERLSLLAAIVESSRDAIISKSLDGVVVSWNPGAEALFGYSAAEMIGQPVQPIIPPERREEETEIINRLRTGQNIEHYETARLTKAGRCIPVSATISPVRDATGAIVRASTILHDITDRKQAQTELAKAKADLEQTNRELEKRVEDRTARLQEMVAELQHVSYAMVHDMRAPLRAMQAFAQLLASESSEGTPEQRQDHLRRIMTAASRLDKLVQDALNYNRAVLQEMPLEPVPLAPLLRGLVETYPNLVLTNADIRLQADLPTVLGNESLLTQCFSNLLGNAVKFVAPGVRPQVAVRTETRDGAVRIWVEDNGIGIPLQAQKRLFGMFQKLDSQYEGTGIGLAIVRKVVERMGGKVGALSEPGRGSRFWVDLPLPPPDTAGPSGRPAGVDPPPKLNDT